MPTPYAAPMSNTSQVPGHQVLNLFTPLVFLPPDVAHRFTVSKYVIVGSFGALIWDILGNMDSD
ncbi:hypothetical protein Hypma_009725 [Hypsizygus marmoreus]|uniref:Uncharacterized protein n=1 Tax=Hypsizygus marmoreus TaxID=39966 RepID=A0A369JMF1_HYPMA|nr:hypothetical protein Hypma_009725 [Hypsizygus marmoreus]